MSEPTYSFNTDGSVDIPVEGKPIRFVKESDLLAVKGGSEAKATEWGSERTKLLTDVAESNRLRDESHQSLLQEQAAKEQLVSQYADYDTHKTRVGELETETASYKESVGKYETELTDRIRQSLLGHGASEEAIKDKTLDQLRNLEEAAKIFGAGRQNSIPAKYDGGGPPAGRGAESEADRAARIIETAEARRGKPMIVTSEKVS